ncbi:MAG: anti-sigma factor family protein [Acidobacteriota bacterium]
MDCRRSRVLIPRFLDGRLSAAASEEFREHIASCLPCRRALKNHRLLREAVAESVKESPRAPEALRSAIRLCMECMDHPGRVACPRLRYRLRLAEPPAGE